MTLELIFQLCIILFLFILYFLFGGLIIAFIVESNILETIVKKIKKRKDDKK